MPMFFDNLAYMTGSDIARFLKRLQASPPQGLMIYDTDDPLGLVQSSLKKAKQPFIVVSIGPNQNDIDFFEQLGQAWSKKAWLILEIKKDVTPTIYNALRELAATGHIADTRTGKDYPIARSSVRILGIIGAQELESSAFDTLLVNFGKVLRTEKPRARLKVTA